MYKVFVERYYMARMMVFVAIVAIVSFLRVCRRSVERREKLRRMSRKQRFLDFRRRKENLNMLFLCSVSLNATARFDRLMWEKTRSCDWGSSLYIYSPRLVN